MPGGEGADKYGDFDPTAFRIEEDSARPAEEGAEVIAGPEMAVDHEVEVNPEKPEGVESAPERRVSPQEYIEAFERIMTGRERDAVVNKARSILKKLEQMNPEQRSHILKTLNETLHGLKKASKGLKDYYESAGLFLEKIEDKLDRR